MIVISDADALLVLRKLNLLEAVLTLPNVDAVIMAYVADHELSSIQDEMQQHFEAERLRKETLRVRTEAWSSWKKLRQAHVDKGEAAAIAWAKHHAPSAILVSNDKGARKAAKKEKMEAIDVLALIVLLVRDYGLDRTLARTRLEYWDDDRYAFGRPKEFISALKSLP